MNSILLSTKICFLAAFLLCSSYVKKHLAVSAQSALECDSSEVANENGSVFTPVVTTTGCHSMHFCQLHSEVKYCYCDSLCELYQDCCSDYSFINSSKPSFKVECVDVSEDRTSRRIVTIASCPLTDEMEESSTTNCSSSDKRLPPATDLNTNITYKNIYCAQCSGALTAQEWMYKSNRFVEPLHTVVHECPERVISDCLSYEVARTHYSNQSLQFGQYCYWLNRCRHSQRLVTNNDVRYRNEFCAMCYGVQSTVEICRNYFPIMPPELVKKIISCGPDEVFDETFEECREIFKTDNGTSCADLSLSCDCKTLVALNASEFEYIDENTVLFNGHILEVLLNTSQGLPVVCSNFTNVINPAGPFGAYRIISFVGSSFSISGCVLVILTFSLFKDLRTLPAKIVLNIAIAVLCNRILVILSLSISTLNTSLCEASAIVLHFFGISEFSWMTILSFEACLSFYRASRLISVQTESIRSKSIVYIIMGWTLPIFVVAICVVINYTTPRLIQYGIRSEGLCWISHFPSSIVAYLTPMIIAVLSQVILFSLSVYFLISSSKTKKLGGSERNTPFLRVVVALFFSGNITWVLGFLGFAGIFSWVWYPYLVLTSVQGLLIFFGFYGTKKVLMLYIASFRKFCHPLKSSFTITS